MFMSSGSVTATNAGSVSNPDDTNRTAFVLHGGVPISLGGSNHFNVQITPELDVGFGSGTIDAMMPAPNTDLSGFLLQVGGRAVPRFTSVSSVFRSSLWMRRSGSFCSLPAARAPRPQTRTSTRRSSLLRPTSILLGISFARTSRHATILNTDNRGVGLGHCRVWRLSVWREVTHGLLTPRSGFIFRD